MLPATDRDFGIGVFWEKGKNTRNGRTLIGHDGSEYGAYTYMQFDPEKQVGIVLLANGDDGNATDRIINQEAWAKRHYALINKLLGFAEDLGD